MRREKVLKGDNVDVGGLGDVLARESRNDAEEDFAVRRRRLGEEHHGAGEVLLRRFNHLFDRNGLISRD